MDLFTESPLFTIPTPFLHQDYGNISQHDPRLREIGLVDKTSMLCGPTCMYNVVYNLRHQLERSPLSADPVSEIFYYTWKVFPDIGIPGNDLIHHGVNIDSLGEALQTLVNKENLNFNVTVRKDYNDFYYLNASETLLALREAAYQNVSTVILIGKYPQADPATASPNQREGGHYIVSLGYDLADPNIFYFLDPSHPEKPRPAVLDLVRPENRENPLYRLIFKDEFGQKSPLLLVEGWIKIRRTFPEIN